MEVQRKDDPMVPEISVTGDDMHAVPCPVRLLIFLPLIAFVC